MAILRKNRMMDVEQLKLAYEQDEVVRAICDHMAERAKNQKSTTLHRIIHHLNSDGYDVKRPGVIAAFRHLQEAGCGRYVQGSHGYKSRFDWSVKSMLVRDTVDGDESIESVEEIGDDFEEYESDMIEHTFILRPDLTVVLELPEDLTPREAQRFSQFVDSLSFGDD